MSSPGGPGSGGGGRPGSLGNPDQYTSTTTAKAEATSFAVPTATTSSSSSSETASPIVAASTTSSVNKSLLIGAIVGGVGGLLLFALFVGCCCTRRARAKKQADKRSSAEPVAYTGLNAAFGGVPFIRSQLESWNERLLDIYVPSPNASHHPITLRGGEITPGSRTGGFESDLFLSAYPNSRGLGGNHPGNSQFSDSYTSPDHYLDDNPYASSAQLYSSYTSSPQIQQYIPYEPSPTSATDPLHLPILTPTLPSPTAASPRHTRDTMGFPFDPRIDALHSPPLQQGDVEIALEPEIPTPIVSPRPQHPSVQQEFLERAIRANLRMAETPKPTLRMTETPTPTPLPLRNPARARVLSQEMVRESPILGMSSPVRLRTSQLQGPPLATSKWMGGLGLDRNASTRTTNTVSTMGVDMITDEELVRLGVGRRI